MQNDAELLRTYVESRSQEAFSALVDRHLALVYQSALRQLGGDGHGAMDVAQEVFVLLSRKAPFLVRHPSLAGWLHSTTHFKASKALRAAVRRHGHHAALHALGEAPMQSSEDDTWRQLKPILDGALLKLNAADREAILLRYLEERAFSEISARLCISEGAAYKRVERALDRLRTLLARRGIHSSVAALAVTLSAQGALPAPTGLASAVTTAAFASAAPAAIGGTLISLMSTTKVGLGVAVLALGLAAAIHETRVGREAERAYDAAHAQTGDLSARVEAATRNLREANAELARLAQAKPVLSAARGSALDVRVPGAPDGKEFLEAHPEVKAAWLANQRAQALARYGELFRSLGLSASQIDRFSDIKIASIAHAALFGFMVNFEDTALTWRQAQRQLRNVLGDSGYQAYLDYDRAMPARDIETQVASATYFSDSPLTGSQATQLTQAIVEALPKTGDPLGGGAWLPWKAIMKSASGILSGSQMSALNDIYQQALYHRAQSDAIRGLPPQ